VIGIALLLVAMLAVFFLRVPCNPLIAYSPSAELRSHRSHALPSYAILSDGFCAVALVALPISLAATALETFVPVVFSAVRFPLITTLRC
jgi:hypothetical protein